MQKALFLDRDGVINTDTGYVYKDITLISGITSFMRKAQTLGYLIIVITNQSGIGRGIFKEEDYVWYMHELQKKLNAKGCYIHADYYCPHLPKDDCDCRKPRPGLIHRAAKKWNIDLRRSVLVGDRISDIEAGFAAGIGKIHLFNGKDWPKL